MTRENRWLAPPRILSKRAEFAGRMVYGWINPAIFAACH
jgi:hypothetical protein